jgi:hypothetical protein
MKITHEAQEQNAPLKILTRILGISTELACFCAYTLALKIRVDQERGKSHAYISVNRDGGGGLAFIVHHIFHPSFPLSN